jgi:hypothetical protein
MVNGERVSPAAVTVVHFALGGGAALVGSAVMR